MEQKDVFISYHTESSKERVLQICQALESIGISCWYAPRNVEGDYATAIVRGIRNCKVFLLILNEFADRSQDVRNEINCAFERMRKYENIAILPFKVDSCALSDALSYYLGRIHMMDGGQPPEPLRIRELVDRIRHILDKGPEITLVVAGEEIGMLETRYRITGKMVYPDPHFVGRREELEAMHDQLSGVVNKLFLVGMGGIGKSEIAKMYLKEHALEYEVVLWVSCEGALQQTIASDALFPIQGMRHKNYPEDDERAYFERKLKLLKEIADRRVLIVMDNFDVTEDPDLEDFCGGSYNVIFTTRYQQNYSAGEVVVRGMTAEAELMELFRAEYTRSLQEKDMQAIHEILRFLEGHPLAIRLVASALHKNRRLAPETMLQMLKSGTAHAEKQSAKGAGTIGGYLQQVFLVSDLSEEEIFVLKNLSLIPLGGIDTVQFADWCELEDFDAIDNLIDHSWIINNPVEDTIHLHPLVMDLMLEELKKDPDCCSKLVENIYKTCQVDVSHTWEHKVWLNELATALYDRLPQDHPQRVMALEAKAKLCMSIADYEKGAQLFCQLLPNMDTLEKKLEIHYKHSHAWVLGGFAQACIDAALPGIEEVKNIPVEQLSKLEGNWLGALYNRLTEAYEILGEYEKAVEYARLAVDKCERFYSKSHESSHGWRCFHLAKALLFAGELEEAEPVIKYSIALFEKIGDKWSANYAYDILGQILLKNGNFTEALELNECAAQILEHHCGREHVDTAVNLEYRGNIFAAMGEKKKAQGYYQQAADIFNRRNCFKKAEVVLQKMSEIV